MSAIPPRFMQELRDRLTLSEVIGRKVKLARAGREFKACCPFHNEKSPSFYINDEKQFYHCFGCGAHGDAVGFVMQHGNISFLEAVEMLAAQAGMEVPRASPREIEQSKQEKSLYNLLGDAASFFTAQLQKPAGRDAAAYLRERGLEGEIAVNFRLGYAPMDGQALVAHLKEAGYTPAQMMEAGLVRRSERDQSLYSFFRDRVMFPVADRRGRVVAFGGRVLPEHLRPLAPGASKPPKYINSGETALFHKGRMLFNESRARQAAAAGQPVIVVEGYVDVIGCCAAGWNGAVAPLGTALTEDQIALLWKMIPAREKSPVLCFDGDEAGRRAAVRACERLMPLLKPDHTALFSFLPEGEDPDSLIRTGGKGAFEAVLGAAIPLVEFLWNHHTAGKSFATPESRAGLTQILEEETARIADRTVQQQYRQMFRDKTFQSFRAAPAKGEKPSSGRRAAAAPGLSLPLRAPARDQDVMALRILLATLINHPGLFGAVEDDLERLPSDSPVLAKLLQAVTDYILKNNTPDPAPLIAHLEAGPLAGDVRIVLGETTYTHAAFARPEAGEDQALKGWQDVCGALQRRRLAGDVRAAGAALAQDFSDENERRLLALQAARAGAVKG